MIAGAQGQVAAILRYLRRPLVVRRGIGDEGAAAVDTDDLAALAQDLDGVPHRVPWMG